jgi:peroxiredoxin
MRDAAPHAAALPETKLTEGIAFPDVSLLDESGELVSLSTLLGAGAVVLFIDPRCEPCAEVTGYWQDTIEAGRIDAASVVAITMRTPFANGEYRRSRGLDFAVYSDDERKLWRDYEITYIPYEVVVDGAGTIRLTNRDSRHHIEPAQLYEAMAD